jgi:hypothetical protein
MRDDSTYASEEQSAVLGQNTRLLPELWEKSRNEIGRRTQMKKEILSIDSEEDKFHNLMYDTISFLSFDETEALHVR